MVAFLNKSSCLVKWVTMNEEEEKIKNLKIGVTLFMASPSLRVIALIIIT